MSRTVITGVIIALAGVLTRSLGYVLQKAGVHWIGHRGEKDRKHYGRMTVWALGYFLTNAAVIFTFLSLRVVDAHIVSALTGLTIAFLIFFSRLILNEQLYWQDYVFSSLIIAAVAGIFFLEKSLQNSSESRTLVVLIFGAFPLLFAAGLSAVSFRKSVKRSTRTRILPVLFALTAGCSAGTMTILMKGAYLEIGEIGLPYLYHPYFFLYIFNGFLNVAALQVAYKWGKMAMVTPIFYVSSFLYRVIGSYAAFDGFPGPLQFFLYCFVLYAVIPIVRRHLDALKVEKGKDEKTVMGE